DGTTVACARGNSVRLWDLASRREVAVLEGHTEELTCLVFSPDGTIMAAGSGDETVRLWDVGGRQRATLQVQSGHINVGAFSPDGKTLATPGHLTTWAMSPASLVGLVAGGGELGLPGTAVLLAFQPRMFAIPGEVTLWDVATGTERFTLRGQAYEV